MYGAAYNARSMSSEPETDRALVRRLTRGDPQAWSDFVRRFLRLVVHVARETLLEKSGRAPEEDVDDIAEEVFAHLVDRNFRAVANLREPYNLKAWIAVAARRKALDHGKRKTLRTVSLDQPAGSDPSSAPIERLVGRDAISGTEREEILRVLEAVPMNPKERLMITLTFFRDLSYAEISDVMRIPENSIGPTIRRALDKIKEALQQRGLSRPT